MESDYKASEWTVMAGSTYYTHPADVIEIKRITRHHRYNPTNFDNDVAALLLNRQPMFGRYPIQVC